MNRDENQSKGVATGASPDRVGSDSAAAEPAGGVHSASNPRLLDADELERRLAAFTAARDWERFHSPKNLAMALGVEAAELVEIFQWSTEAESRAIMQTGQAEHVGQELADIAMYLVRIASVLGVDLNDAIAKKLALNAQKYPAP
jgi:NTP pyrophosphatase (non-canonical NTP hydrolase)